MKRGIILFMVCIAAMGWLGTTADAKNLSGESAIQMEDMRREMIDVSQAARFEGSPQPRITYSISDQVAGQAVHISDDKISLAARQVITINCSYSPASANMDFGVIAPDGYFYFLNVEGGSINQSIRVNQSGSYAVAVRNNSSYTVNVVGFVNY